MSAAPSRDSTYRVSSHLQLGGMAEDDCRTPHSEGVIPKGETDQDMSHPALTTGTADVPVKRVGFSYRTTSIDARHPGPERGVEYHMDGK